VRCEVGATSDINCASLGQCLRVGGFVNYQCLLFCPSFWYVSMTFEVHKT